MKNIKANFNGNGAKQIETLIMWDLDGTIFDSEAGPVSSVSKIVSDLAAENGVIISSDDVSRDYAGLGQFEKFEIMAKNFGVKWDSDKIQQLGTEHELRKSEIYKKDVIPFVSFAKESIEAMSQKQGWLQCIVSTNPSTRSKYGLTKMGVSDHFGDRFYGPDLVNNNRKPKPDSFIYAMEQNPKASLYVGIEDSEPGILGMKKAGEMMGIKVLSIAYIDPVFKNSEKKVHSFLMAGADVVVSSLSRVVPVIEDNLKQNGIFKKYGYKPNLF